MRKGGIFKISLFIERLPKSRIVHINSILDSLDGVNIVKNFRKHHSAVEYKRYLLQKIRNLSLLARCNLMYTDLFLLVLSTITLSDRLVN